MSIVLGRLCFSKKNNTCTWTITSNNDTILLGAEEVISPGFKVSDDDEKSFQLKLVKKYRGVWGLSLRRLNPTSSLSCEYVINVLKNGQIVDTRSDNYTFFFNNNEKMILDINGISFNHFSITCQLIFASKNKENFLKTKSVNKNIQLGSTFNFEWIFLDKKFSDVVLRTSSGREIAAHRVVLATASPVFQAMFNHDMLENNSRAVNMTDVTHEVAVEMLRYIYTGSVKIQEFSLAAEVLVAAEKYQLEELKNECEQILISHLSTANAIEALQAADTYNAKHLEKEAVDFVKRKMNETLPLNEVKDMLLCKARLFLK